MEIWIMGGGKFGGRAAALLAGLHPRASITLVDLDSQRLTGLDQRIIRVRREAVDFLARALSFSRIPDWIVAAVPVHLAFEWMRRKMGERLRPINVPEPLADRLPNPLLGADGQLYAGRSQTLCPEDCPEPPGFCPATGQVRGRDLYLLLEELDLENFETVVIRSTKLAPGVGGYPGRELLLAAERMKTLRGGVIISTACPCQAVVHAAQIDQGKSGPDSF